MSTDLPRCPLRAPGVEWQCKLLAGHLEDHRTEMAGRFVCWDTSPEDVLAAYRAGREDAARDILDALDRMKERIEEKVSDRKIAACQKVGLHMASVKIIEMADKWGVQPTEEQRAHD